MPMALPPLEQMLLTGRAMGGPERRGCPVATKATQSAVRTHWYQRVAIEGVRWRPCSPATWSTGDTAVDQGPMGSNVRPGTPSEHGRTGQLVLGRPLAPSAKDPGREAALERKLELTARVYQ